MQTAYVDEIVNLDKNETLKFDSWPTELKFHSNTDPFIYFLIEDGQGPDNRYYFISKTLVDQDYPAKPFLVVSILDYTRVSRIVWKISAYKRNETNILLADSRLLSPMIKACIRNSTFANGLDIYLDGPQELYVPTTCQFKIDFEQPPKGTWCLRSRYAIAGFDLFFIQDDKTIFFLLRNVLKKLQVLRQPFFQYVFINQTWLNHYPDMINLFYSNASFKNDIREIKSF